MLILSINISLLIKCVTIQLLIVSKYFMNEYLTPADAALIKAAVENLYRRFPEIGVLADFFNWIESAPAGGYSQDDVDAYIDYVAWIEAEVVGVGGDVQSWIGTLQQVARNLS